MMRQRCSPPVLQLCPPACVALIITGLLSGGAGCSAGASHFDIAIPTDIGGALYVGNTSAIAREASEAEAALESGNGAIARLEDALEQVPNLTGGGLVFSADGAVFARTDGNGGLEVRETSTGALRHALTVAELISVLAVSRDGTLVAVSAGPAYGTVHIVRATDATETDTGVPAVGQFQLVGATLFVVDNNLKLSRIAADGGAPTAIATPAPFVSTIVAAPDGDRLFGLARADTNLEDDTLFVLDAEEDTARALELPAPNPRLLAVGKSGCLGLLSGTSLWLSGADGTGFTTAEGTAIDERTLSLAVAPDCRAAVFSIPDELLVAWVTPGEMPHAVTAGFAPFTVVARPQ